MSSPQQKGSQNSFYNRISLPKHPSTSNTNKSISTRCISVNKNEYKTNSLINPLAVKPIAPPKQLTVNFYRFSIILEKETMKPLLKKY